MKWLLGILMFVSMSLSGPSVCQHAFAADTQSSQQSHMMHNADQMDHSEHAMHNSDRSGPVDHSEHCPDDCDGGIDCEGCSIVISMIDSVSPEQLYTPPMTQPSRTFMSFIRSTSSPDIPPPKHLLFA